MTKSNEAFERQDSIAYRLERSYKCFCLESAITALEMLYAIGTNPERPEYLAMKKQLQRRLEEV